MDVLCSSSTCPGVYKITNLVNGKYYVGSAVDPRKRWNTHLSSLRRGRHHSQHLQAAFFKYGEAMFEFSIIEDVQDPKDLISREQFFIDEGKTSDGSYGYNISPTAGSILGTKRSEESRMRTSLAIRNLPTAFKPGQTAWNKGKHWSIETRRKMSLAQTGRKQDPESIRKRTEKVRGSKRTQETKDRISKALRAVGWKLSHPAWNKGKPWSDEARKRMSEGHKNCSCRYHNG